jgi:phage terminase Nu1 subunit (DNA packaging protein)
MPQYAQEVFVREFFVWDDGLPGVTEGNTGPFITLQGLIWLYGVDGRSIMRWGERGWVPKPTSRGVYDLKAVVQGVYESLLAQVNRQGTGGEAEAADLRRKQAQAALAELDLAKARGELVAAAEVERQAFKRGRELRNAFESIPSRISAVLAAESDPHKVREILAGEIREVLLVLSNPSEAPGEADGEA